MVNVLTLAIAQSLLLVLGQVTLKISLQQMSAFQWSWAFFASVFSNLWFAACGLSFALSSLLWMYIVKHFPLSVAYPMVSLSYVMGMLAAVFIFHEQVPLVRWIGLALIIIGVILIAK
ncbi:MAG: EamA family transporter [Prevotella sp.]